MGEQRAGFDGFVELMADWRYRAEEWHKGDLARLFEQCRRVGEELERRMPRPTTQGRPGGGSSPRG